MATHAIHAPAVQGPEHPDQREVGRSDAREGNPFEDRSFAVAHLLAHGPDQRVYECFVGRYVPMRTVESEPREGAVHQARDAPVHGVVVQAPTRGAPRLPALYEHVGSFEQVQERAALALVLQIEDGTALAPVVSGVGDGQLLPARVAARRLYPDHVGAIVREHAGGSRSCGARRAIDHAQACERTRHSPSSRSIRRGRGRNLHAFCTSETRGSTALPARLDQLTRGKGAPMGTIDTQRFAPQPARAARSDRLGTGVAVRVSSLLDQGIAG